MNRLLRKLDLLTMVGTSAQAMRRELLEMMRVRRKAGWGPDPLVCRWCGVWLDLDPSRSKALHADKCFAVKHLGQPGRRRREAMMGMKRLPVGKKKAPVKKVSRGQRVQSQKKTLRLRGRTAKERAEILPPRDRKYLEALEQTVKLLKDGWHSAREMADALGISHQSPWNRLRKLRKIGYVVKERTDATTVRLVKRFHIEGAWDEKKDRAIIWRGLPQPESRE